jgi:Cys-rich repeat protein
MNGCNPNNSVCDTANNRCVECLSDMDCADEMTQKICDLRPTGTSMLPRSQCVQCVETAHCPAGATCGMNNTCSVACGTANCTINPTGNNICDAPNNRCVDCMNDGDCAVEMTDKHCDLTLNTAGLPRYACEECTDTAHCAAGQTCVNNACVTQCGTATCTAMPTGNNICDAPNNRCVDCMTDADCAVEPNNPRCDTTPNAAGLPRYACEECADNSHCPAGQVCVDNECEPTCMTDTDCSADGGGQAPHCNPTTKVCAECGSDAHCTGTQTVCIAGSCEDCTTDMHCQATQPMTPFCRIADNNCVACLTNDHCTPPATCNTQGRCGGGGGGMDGGGMPPPPDSGNPPPPDSGNPPPPDSGNPPPPDSGGGGG